MTSVAPFIGPALQGVAGIASGIGGKQQQQKLDQQIDTSNKAFTDMMNAGGQTLSNFGQLAEGFNNPELSAEVLGRARNLGDQLKGIADTAVQGIGRSEGQNIALNAAQGGFNFDPLRQNLGQALQLAQDSAARARATSAQQGALAMQQGADTLTAQLAQRGLGPRSGATVAGLTDLNRQNALGRMQLESDLANQAGQMALQGAQMDTQNLLAHNQMASQYDLGNRQMQGQLGLGLSQLNDQQALMRAGLQSDALTQGFNALQGTYQQNFLNPFMQMQGLIGNLAGGMMGTGAQGLMGNTGLTFEQAKAGGAGLGAGLAGLTGGITNALNPPGGAAGGGNSGPGWLQLLQKLFG